MASLLIAVLILPRAVTLLRSALAVLMDFTPQELDLAQVRSHMLGIDHVEEVHDLHAWTVASGMPVLTAHVVVRNECLRRRSHRGDPRPAPELRGRALPGQDPARDPPARARLAPRARGRLLLDRVRYGR